MLKFLRKHKAFILLTYVFLLTIHFGFKDYFFVTGIIFYTFPLLTLIIALIPLFIIFSSNKNMRIVLLCSAGILSLIWFQNYSFNYESNNTCASYSILFWNIAKQKDYNIEDLKQILEKENIDAIIFVEAIHKNNAFNKEFNRVLGDYNVEFLDGNMLIAAKGDVIIKNFNEEHLNYRINHLQIELKQNTYSFALIDIYGNPLHYKKYALNTVMTFVNDNNVDIILGDFNIPFESIHFEKLKLNYNSLRDYQNGVSATWPASIPLVELDQIWLKKNIKPLSLEKHYFKSSDHALLIGKFCSHNKNQ